MRSICHPVNLRKKIKKYMKLLQKGYDFHSYPFFKEQEELLKEKGDSSSLGFFGFENYLKELIQSDSFNSTEKPDTDNSNINLLEKIHIFYIQS